MYNTYSIESFINYINDEDDIAVEGIGDFFSKAIETIKRTIKMIFITIKNFIPNAIVRLKNIGTKVQLDKYYAKIVNNRYLIKYASLFSGKFANFKYILENPDEINETIHMMDNMLTNITNFESNKVKAGKTVEVSVNAIITTINATKTMEYKAYGLLQYGQKMIEANKNDEKNKNAAQIMIRFSNILTKLTALISKILKSAISSAKSIDKYKNEYDEMQKK